MSTLWAQALHKAFPEQPGRFRPSNAGNCGLQTAAKIEGVPTDNPNYHTIWQQQLGFAAQDIVLKVIPHLGFKVLDIIKETEGAIPGEVDAEVQIMPGNAFMLPADRRVGLDVKGRSVYAYNHVFSPTGDFMEVDASIGMQQNIYWIQRNIRSFIIVLVPWDGSAVRNDRRRLWPETSPYVRFFMCNTNMELYQIALERQQIIEKYGTKVFAEFDPTAGKFPCTYCDVMNWCKLRGPRGEIEMPAMPKTGLPYRELELP